jgi:predicted ATP-grasp superfamily ATP-dependent carboligase
MISKLDPNLLKDDNFYYFSMLSDRFEPLNKSWAEGLEKRFHKKFKPIFVLPFKHNQLFEEDNYIVLNKRLFDLQKKLKRKDVINLIYPEDLNKQFCESEFIQKLIKQLIDKQGRLFVLSFTSVWLDLNNPKITILGPNNKIAAKFDDKVEHIKVFEKLKLPINKTIIYQSFEELRKKHKEYPCFLSANFSSGGFESKIIYTEEDLKEFYDSLRPINQKGLFIAARLLKDIVLAPNSSAIVLDKDKTVIVCITDQLLRENRYMGNLYPSRANKQHQKIISETTIKVGNYLSRQGFRGLFGLDFLITKKGDCYPTDLNPRRQGGYYCNVCMSNKIDIIDLELRLVLNEPLPKIDSKDFQLNYCWAHSKLVPYFHNMEIEKVFEIGNPTEPFNKIGSQYKAIYYPKKHILIAGNPGFYLTTDNSYFKMKRRLIKETEKTISKSYSIYEGL